MTTMEQQLTMNGTSNGLDTNGMYNNDLPASTTVVNKGGNRPSLTGGGDQPRFVRPLEGGATLPEGEPVHIETRVAPYADSSLTIDWIKDGKPLTIGSRFNTVYDRGYVVLDILYTFPEDSGEYVCQVKTRVGISQSNAVSVRIIPESGVITDTQLPEDEMLDRVQQLEASWLNAEASHRPIDRNYPTGPPQFLTTLPPNTLVNQGQPVSVMTQVAHPADSTLTLEWMRDGKPVSTGSRFNLTCERGFAVLDIAYCYPEDSGVYICLARNALGQTESSPMQLVCQADETVVTRSNLSELSISHLRQIEDPGEEHNPRLSADIEGIPPVFLTNLEPAEVSVIECQFARFDVRVNSGNGNKVVVEWYKDGVLINMGSRITGGLELGLATLHIRSVYAEDSGQYVCVVATEHGRADSTPASLVCSADNFVNNTTQLKNGMQALQNLEADLLRAEFLPQNMEEPRSLPTVVKPIDGLPPMDEGESAHFDVRVEPMDDDHLSVEWYKNSEQLTSGSRFRVEFERGFASLDIRHCIPEDSGEYWCLAKNKMGQTESNKVQLQCAGGAGVITSSNLVEGSDGLKWIQEMEGDYSQQGVHDIRYGEAVEVDSPPIFEINPLSTVAGEGGPAKFLVRVSGFPCPEIIWYMNGETVQSDSVNKVYNDGPIGCLELSRCTQIGEVEVKVVATNPHGSVEVVANLLVVPKEDFRPEMKHIKPENPYMKLAHLKKVECSSELTAAFKKKPTAETIRNIERGAEMKARFFKSPEVLEAEQMYDKISATLKTQTSMNSGQGSFPTTPNSPANFVPQPEQLLQQFGNAPEAPATMPEQ